MWVISTTRESSRFFHGPQQPSSCVSKKLCPSFQREHVCTRCTWYSTVSVHLGRSSYGVFWLWTGRNVVKTRRNSQNAVDVGVSSCHLHTVRTAETRVPNDFFVTRLFCDPSAWYVCTLYFGVVLKSPLRDHHSAISNVASVLCKAVDHTHTRTVSQLKRTYHGFRVCAFSIDNLRSVFLSRPNLTPANHRRTCLKRDHRRRGHEIVEGGEEKLSPSLTFVPGKIGNDFS